MCIKGCEYNIGRIQLTAKAGVYYIDHLHRSEVFDNVAVEYLVKNSSYNYKWVPSRNGVKVENALEISNEGQRPFYIGITKYNYNVVIGKVRLGEGLYFTNIDGKQKFLSSYNVLTCTSADAFNKIVSNAKMNENYYSKFGCPVRKIWSFAEWQCVCKDEWKGLIKPISAKWNEETCSYVSTLR